MFFNIKRVIVHFDLCAGNIFIFIYVLPGFANSIEKGEKTLASYGIDSNVSWCKKRLTATDGIFSSRIKNFSKYAHQSTILDLAIA